MTESAILQAILTQSSQAAREASACRASIEALDSRMDEHVQAESARYAGHDTRLREVEVDLQDLKTTKSLAAKAGAKAGRRNAAIIATVIIAIVEVGQQVYAAVAP